MKKKSTLYVLTLLLLSAAVLFTACKKRKAFKEEDGQASVDNKYVQGENDAAIGDVNDVIGQDPLLHGRTGTANSAAGVLGTVCGLSVDTNGISQGTVKLNYDGSTCRNRTRSGSIRLTIQNYSSGKRWKNAGCAMKVDYLAYKVTRSSDGKSVLLNGTQTITNETGGTWLDLLLKTQSALASTIKGTNLSVTFEDGKTASYNINRRITYSFPDNVLTCTGEGIGSLNGLINLENYGLTRDGDEFTSQLVTPIVWNLTCGAWAPVQGEASIKVDSKDFALKVMFSVDAGGNPVAASPNACAYGWKVEWSYRKKTNKKVFGYY